MTFKIQIRSSILLHNTSISTCTVLTKLCGLTTRHYKKSKQALCYLTTLRLKKKGKRRRERGEEGDKQGKRSLVGFLMLVQPTGIVSLWECLSRSPKVLKSPWAPLGHPFIPTGFVGFATNGSSWAGEFWTKQGHPVSTELPAPTTFSAVSLLSWQWSYLVSLWDNSRHTTDKA